MKQVHIILVLGFVVQVATGLDYIVTGSWMAAAICGQSVTACFTSRRSPLLRSRFHRKNSSKVVDVFHCLGVRGFLGVLLALSLKFLR